MGRDETLAFFMAHRPKLIGYASGIVGSRAQAEELVQEAWLRFDDACRLRLLEEPLGYLYQIVRNLALAWALTLPAAIVLAGVLFWIFSFVF